MRFARRALALAAIGSIGAYVYLTVRLLRHERLDPATVEAPGARIYIRGIGIHIVEAGDRSNPPIMLVHGFGGSGLDYRRIVGPLAEAHHVVAVDLPGYGYSDRPRSHDYSLRSQAAVVRDVLDRLGIGRAVVVGHSLGGAVVQRFAIDYPERVDRLILLAPATDSILGRRMPPPLLIDVAFPLFMSVHSHSTVRRRQLGTAVHNSEVLTAELLDAMRQRGSMRGSARAMARTIRGIGAEPPPDPRRIEAPTLIVWGEFDRWLRPSHGEPLAAAIPKARLVIVPSAGHLLCEEQPRAVSEAILGFLREPAAPEGTRTTQLER